ncbi:MAG: putative metal-binding motif-containing protein [Deltaproteobacteria bacterium]|nr:putative metal-binding motif-containing protein [Deltaproteobacteria bacterium]
MRTNETLAIALALLLVQRGVDAKEGGISGVSGRNGRACELCHSGGARPTVSLRTPARMYVRTSTTLRLSISGGQSAGGGLDVSAERGTLMVAPNEVAWTRLSAGEITHRVPKQGELAWEMIYTAPAQAGSYRIWAAGNSVNLDRSPGGDRAAEVIETIVVDPCPDSDGDGYELAACNSDPASGADCDDQVRTVHPGRKEVCNGVDDDCLRGVDEGCEPCSSGTTRACYSGDSATRGVGSCSNGSHACQGEYWPLDCPGEILPTPEVCNDRDDDCDGVVDQMTEECYSALTGEGIGECRSGVRSCAEGRWTACEGEVVPTPDLCDEKDNDCDGQADEDCLCAKGSTRPCYSGPPGTANVGECHTGFAACVTGLSYESCRHEQVPVAEIACDGVDQDCDGEDAPCELEALSCSGTERPSGVGAITWWMVLIGGSTLTRRTLERISRKGPKS